MLESRGFKVYLLLSQHFNNMPEATKSNFLQRKVSKTSKFNDPKSWKE